MCVPSVCGDSVITAGIGETCDDSNTLNNDGCSSSCLIENGYNCIGQPSVCSLIVCGNGNVEGV